jgi:hypothetical protein
MIFLSYLVFGIPALLPGRPHHLRNRWPTSFCIIHHFDLNVGEVAFGYLAHWGDGENAINELLECGERIRTAAHQVITWVEEHHMDVVADGIEQPIQGWTELVPA